jgi:hypothetical protein
MEGDIFDSAILDTTSAPPTPEAPPLLSLENSLTGMQNHISVIHISMVFHLFLKDKQLELARRLAALLSPLPGSIIFGSQIGLPVPGIHTRNTSGLQMFCHSPDSWRTLWHRKVQPWGILNCPCPSYWMPHKTSSWACATFASPSKAVNIEFNPTVGTTETSLWGRCPC